MVRTGCGQNLASARRSKQERQPHSAGVGKWVLGSFALLFLIGVVSGSSKLPKNPEDLFGVWINNEKVTMTDLSDNVTKMVAGGTSILHLKSHGDFSSKDDGASVTMHLTDGSVVRVEYDSFETGRWSLDENSVRFAPEQRTVKNLEMTINDNVRITSDEVFLDGKLLTEQKVRAIGGFNVFREEYDKTLENLKNDMDTSEFEITKFTSRELGGRMDFEIRR